MSDLSKFIAHENWPPILAKALPALLQALLDQKNGESLERLQLINVKLSFEENRNSDEMPKPTLSRLSEGQNKFLMLEGKFKLSSIFACKIIITYFVRGQKKYFKHELILSKPNSWLKPERIELSQIHEFFAALKQSNTFFDDPSLSELNGRAQVLVPNEMLILKMLELAQGLKPAISAKTSFVFSFIHSLEAKKDFRFGLIQEANKLNISLYADESLIAMLQIVNSH